MAIYETSSEEDTAKLAANIASSAKAGSLYLLDAPMGAGKSSFARGFIQALCGSDTDVPSPTFTIVQTYDCPIAPIWHFDLYRIENPNDVLNIGWEDGLSKSNICLIEWPQKAKGYLPPDATCITIEIIGETQRKITVNVP